MQPITNCGFAAPNNCRNIQVVAVAIFYVMGGVSNRLQRVQHTLTTGDTLRAWLERVGAGGEPVDPRLAEAAADLVETMRTRPQGVDRALARFGNALGGDGWPIAQVGQWLHLLSDVVPRRQRWQEPFVAAKPLPWLATAYSCWRPTRVTPTTLPKCWPIGCGWTRIRVAHTPP